MTSPHDEPKRASSAADVRRLYEESADSYAEMMDAEIDLPLYANTLSRLAQRVAGLPGSIVDTSCGPGHMLARYHERYDPERELIGIDLSPRMVSAAAERLGSKARLIVGDMRDLGDLESGSAAAVLSFFAVHHLEPDGVAAAFNECARVLCSGGQLIVAAWEGSGTIDYGDQADVVAFRYTAEELAARVEESGYVVSRCSVEPVEEMPMDAVYLDGTKR